MNEQEREAQMRRVLDAELGMRWFNALAEHQRALWLTRAGSARRSRRTERSGDARRPASSGTDGADGPTVAAARKRPG